MGGRRFFTGPEYDRVEQTDRERHIEKGGPGEPEILGKVLRHIVIRQRHHDAQHTHTHRNSIVMKG